MTNTPDPSNIEYRPAVITFLDILGFREIVDSRPADEVQRILNRVRAFAARETGEEGYERTQAFSFSDSVIRVRHFDTDFPNGALFLEILSLVHAQGELINDGVLLRGGVTVGDIHAENNSIFGPGFVRAYELESGFANYPRIVVGVEALQALRTDHRLRSCHHDVDESVGFVRDLLRRSEDGLWFVDYLRAFCDELDDPEIYPELLARHRETIISGANSVSPRVRQKYHWLAMYHNQVCGEAGVGDDYLISSGDIPGWEVLVDRSPPIFADE